MTSVRKLEPNSDCLPHTCILGCSKSSLHSEGILDGSNIKVFGMYFEVC